MRRIVAIRYQRTIDRIITRDELDEKPYSYFAGGDSIIAEPGRLYEYYENDKDDDGDIIDEFLTEKNGNAMSEAFAAGIGDDSAYIDLKAGTTQVIGWKIFEYRYEGLDCDGRPRWCMTHQWPGAKWKYGSEENNWDNIEDEYRRMIKEEDD